jgi:histidyl-tRNA synthetase
MAVEIKTVKGMKDILPSEIGAWQYLESRLRQLFNNYGYSEIRMPILEQTALFQRGVGEVTDIVEKEMYTFVDRGGDSLTLRPESTAQCVRSILEHNLIRHQTPKLWYQGPMFRRENPQKGRYRQFHQFGVEAIGLPGPDVDLEQLLMMFRAWHQLGLHDKIALQLNSLGTPGERELYRTTLVSYLKGHYEMLDEECQRRLHTNPLRVLDTKNPALQEIMNKAPNMLEFLGEDSLLHFEAIQSGLKACGVPFTINHRLVRGLDYYSHTVYEWVTTELGAQGTVCGGGRYNGLVEKLGGPDTPAVGFSLGVERLVMLLVDNKLAPPMREADVYFIAEGEKAQLQSLKLAEQIRDRLPSLRLLLNSGGGSFKSQFKRADKSGALFAVILGEQESENGTLGVKSLRGEGQQETLSIEMAIEYLKQQLVSGS